MELEYGVKNFRVFDKHGADFNLKPITLLTGANCAGKSSLVKSILLLKQYLDNCRYGNVLDPISSSISFLDESINIKGINSVFNNKSEGCEDVVFTFSNTPISPRISIGAEFTFSSKQNDFFNNGWIKKFRCFCSIDGNSEDFLDIVFEKESSHIKTFNVSGNIFRAFVQELEMATALSLLLMDGVDPEILLKKGSSYLTLVQKNELNRGLPFSSHQDRKRFVNEMVYYYRKHPHFLELLIKFPIKDLLTFERNNTLFFVPVLPKIGRMTPSELALFFKNDFRFSNELNEEWRAVYRALFDKIVADYSKSGYSCFLEYYQSKEKSALSRYGQGKNVSSHGLSGENDGYLSSLKRVFTESFEPHLPSGDWSIRSDKQFLNAIQNKAYVVDIGMLYMALSCGIPTEPINDEQFRAIFQSRTTKAFNLFRDYIITTVNALFRMKDFRHVEYVESFLCPVQRSYSIYDKGNRMSMLLISYLAVSEQYRLQSYEKVGFVERWIHELGLGSDFQITQDTGATNIMLSVLDPLGNRVSTADLGQGVTQLLFLLICIEKNIMELRLQKHDITFYGEHYRTICIVEPEIGLHPSWQSTLARIVEEAQRKHHVHFIIETHSEYLIRATQAIVAKTVKNEDELKDIPFVVYYMEKGGKAYDMEYQVSGRFKKPFGTGFFDEAGKSSIEILRKERRMRDEESR